MFGRYSLSFVRKLRTPSKRTGESLARIRADFIPLSEEELTQISEKGETKPDRSFDSPTIDKSIIMQVDESEMEFVKRKKSKSKLKDFVVSKSLEERLTEENYFDYLMQAVTPLSMYTYEKQLQMKQKHCEEVLREIRQHLKSVEAPHSSVGDRLPCPVGNILHSPDIFGYRNMDKFSVYTGVDGNPKTVGYRLGLPSDPLMRCADPSPLVTIRDSHKLILTHFQNFIKESPYKTCLNINEGGVWRSLIVRSNLKGELMAVVIINPNDLAGDEKEELKHNLHNYYFNGPGSVCGLSSLYFQACSRNSCTRKAAPYELIAGDPYLTEECLGSTFRISPDSAFLSNTRSAEMLFESIQSVAKLSNLSTLLDVCCGSGNVSIHLSSSCRGVVGIDADEAAIDDAKINAQINRVSNATFMHDKIEKGLPLLINDLKDTSDVVAVLNPPRAGLYTSVIESLRKCQSIKKIIYITCKPENYVLRNLVMLGSTLTSTSMSDPLKKKVMPGIQPISPEHLPFALKYAIPVDLFPHTAHVEFVFVLERVKSY